MDKRTAQRLAKQIERDDAKCQAAGLRRELGGGYSVTIVDTRNGYPAVVQSVEDLERRQCEAKEAAL